MHARELFALVGQLEGRGVSVEDLGRHAGPAQDDVSGIQDHALAHEGYLLLDAPDHISGVESKFLLLLCACPEDLKIKLDIPRVRDQLRLNIVAHRGQLLPKLEVEGVRPSRNRFPPEAGEIT